VGAVHETAAAAGAVEPDLPPGPDFFAYAVDEAFAALLREAGLEDVRVDTERWREVIPSAVASNRRLS